MNDFSNINGGGFKPKCDTCDTTKSIFMSVSPSGRMTPEHNEYRCYGCLMKGIKTKLLNGKWINYTLIEIPFSATPPPKPSGTMERALELAVESTVLRHECNSSRMTLCKRGGDYEQCLKCWQDYFISKAQQEEGK